MKFSFIPNINIKVLTASIVPCDMIILKLSVL